MKTTTEPAKPTNSMLNHREISLSHRWQHFKQQHIRAYQESTLYLKQHPLSHSLTCLVIAIALALPTGLYIAIKNLDSLRPNLDQAAQISVFVETNAENIASTLKEINSLPEVASVETIAPETALQELESLLGLQQSNSWTQQPLPTVLVITPQLTMTSSEALKELAAKIGTLPGILQVQLDHEWLARLFSFVELGERMFWLLATLLIFSVLLIVGNTISLTLSRHRQDIDVMALVGGTASFIRRPYLYLGAWYGLIGGIIAWILCTGALVFLQDAVTQITTLYASSWQLSGLGISSGILLLMISALLGILGARLATQRILIG